MNFFILDDDISTRKILARIINDEALGEVIGENSDPVVAVSEILTIQPDIVLIDLLMPFQDGIETVELLKNKNFTGKFIMISQIENKDMVGKAYISGVEYFIHKPINKVEVQSIVTKVIEQVKMEKSIRTIKESLSILPFQNTDTTIEKPNIDTVLRDILTDLGILGESGSSDVMELMKQLQKGNEDFESVPLKSLYIDVLRMKNQDTSEKSVKAFEQRLRRAINQALTNLASLGLTDYTHPKFEVYSSKFFDFNEVRLKMNELDEKNGSRPPRINIRKFLYAFFVEMQGRIK